MKRSTITRKTKNEKVEGYEKSDKGNNMNGSGKYKIE
jgi:hypothetical protein